MMSLIFRVQTYVEWFPFLNAGLSGKAEGDERTNSIADVGLKLRKFENLAAE